MARLITRRRFLLLGAALPGPFFLAACGGDDTPKSGATTTPSRAATEPPATTAVATSSATPAVLQPTPACVDDDDATIAQTEGPFFTPDSPERTSLLDEGLEGERMVVQGYVLTRSCAPVAGALVDFWHADVNGDYDNVGYRLRGHQFAGADGSYRLETIVAGLYTGRTRHIHVKVQAPNEPVLTTQLYFPAEPGNEGDGIFDPALLMNVTDIDEGKAGAFNFVLDLA